MRPSLSLIQRRDWDGLQSRYVLPTARRLYLLGAVVAVGLALLALVAALFFELASWSGSTQETLPEVPDAAIAEMSLEKLDARFSAPTNIKFMRSPISLPVAEDAVLGHFSANSGVPIASSPDGFQIIGGKDNELFKTSSDPADSRGTALRATAALATALKANIATGRDYELRIIANDTAGNTSAPATLKFRLLIGEKAASPVQEETVIDSDNSPEALKAVSHELAKLAAAKGSPEYLVAYNYARAEPVRCDADGNDRFITEYARAFQHVRSHLKPENLSIFYEGVCRAWQDAVREAGVQHDEAQRAHAAAMERNLEAEAGAQFRNAAARTARNVALAFALSAIMTFMTIALFLAFLAMEGHSNAVREAIEVLARRASDVEKG